MCWGGGGVSGWGGGGWMGVMECYTVTLRVEEKECKVVTNYFFLVRHFDGFGLVCGFTSQLTAIVMLGANITTLFSWASLNKRLTSISYTYFRL